MSVPPAGLHQARNGRPSPHGGLAIEAERLEKSFGGRRALAGVDLAVTSGTVYGLLGPNGAGKTTTVRILATLLAPDGGRAQVAGHDVAAEPHLVRRAIALAGQSATVDEDLTGRENLTFLGRLAGLPRAAAKARAAGLLATFGLEQAAARQARTYSGGMRRRLDLAASLITRAEVYFLDEPTTQYLEEADQLAARIAVIDHGTVIAEGTPGQLKAAAGPGTLRITLADPAQRPQAMQTLAGLLHVPTRDEPDPAVLTATLPAASPARPASEQAAAAITELGRAGLTVDGFALGQPSLDAVFLALTSRPAASSAPAAGSPATAKGSS